MRKRAFLFVIFFGMVWSVGSQMGGIHIGTIPNGQSYPYGVGNGCRQNQSVYGTFPNCPMPGERIYPMMPTPSGLLGPARQNAYGPGVWSDSTGRPFHWQTQDGQKVPLGNVKPDAYGPGIGMDKYGRPVKAVPGQ